MYTQAEFLRATYPVTMTEQAKAQWLKDLRNPETKQTRQMLSDTLTGRCCLGVLGDVQKIRKHPMGVSKTIMEYFFDSEGCTGTPPDFFSGMTTALLVHLADLNDKQRKSFKQIAKFVESNIFPSYPGLRILNHYPDQYYVYAFDGSPYATDKRFDKNILMGNRYTQCIYPNELSALFTRRALKAFLKAHGLSSKSLF